MKIGKPTHFKMKNGATACGIVGAEYAAFDPRDVDCERCKRTEELNAALFGNKKAAPNG